MTPKPKTRTLDDSTAASEPGGVNVSHQKLRMLRPDLYGLRGLIHRFRSWLGRGFPQRVYIEEQLRHGDSRAAVVVLAKPLLVAAYTDELDCVALLRFPDSLVDEYRLRNGWRLLTVNCYRRRAKYDGDLILGPNLIKRWTGFHPIIADFVSDDTTRIEWRKKRISEDEWQRTLSLGKEYIQIRPGVARDGRPVFSGMPAKLQRQPAAA